MIGIHIRCDSDGDSDSEDGDSCDSGAGVAGSRSSDDEDEVPVRQERVSDTETNDNHEKERDVEVWENTSLKDKLQALHDRGYTDVSHNTAVLECKDINGLEAALEILKAAAVAGINFGIGSGRH